MVQKWAGGVVEQTEGGLKLTLSSTKVASSQYGIYSKC